MAKRLLTISMCAAMIFSMTACQSGDNTSSNLSDTSDVTEGSENNSVEQSDVVDSTDIQTGGFILDGTWPKETVKIAVETYDVTDQQFINIQTYYNYLKNYFNIDFVYSESIASAEDEMKFIENASAAGCSAMIAYYNISQSESVKLCAQKGMYYWGQADEDAIYDECKDMEYYLGAYDNGEGDYNAGYSMAKEMIDQGCKKLIYVSGGKDFGIQMFIDRAQGFYDAAEEFGAEVVYEVPGWPGTDAFTAAQTKACDMDFDGLASSFTAAPWFQPLANVGKLDGSVKIAAIGTIDDTYKDLANAGIVSCVLYDCEESFWGSAIPIILNAVTGHGEILRNADGSAANYEAPRWIVNSPESYNTIFDTHSEGEWFVTATDLADFIVEYNPNTSYESFTEFFKNMTIDHINK